MDITGTLGVTGATTLSSTLGVTGATTLSSTLGVTGATTATGGLNVDTISEITSANGVVIDGVTLKDGGATVTADVSFGDNDKAIFGAGSDLQIFHDAGGTSHIRESGPSHLYIEASNLRLKSSADTGETYLTANLDGAVSLYYDNAVKLATTSTGVDITGTLTSDGLTVDGSSVVATFGNTASNNYTQIKRTTSNVSTLTLGVSSNLAQITGGPALSLSTGAADGTSEVRRMLISSGGDISFYEDTGTTAKLHWSAADERLGIGTSSPSDVLHVKGGSSTDGILIQNPLSGSFYNAKLEFTRDNTSGGAKIQTERAAAGGVGLSFSYTSSNANEVSGTYSEAMRIDSSGNVGIGTDSPDNNSGYTALTMSNTSGSGGGQVYVKASSAVGVFGADNASSGTNAKVILQTNTSHPLVLGTNGTERMRIDSSGRVKLHEDLVQDEVKATTTATTQVAIDTFPHASYDGAKVVITAATSADTYVTELLIATNGTTAVATEYGQIGTGSALATYDVDISGADVRILATPASTTSTTFRVAMTLT